MAKKKIRIKKKNIILIAVALIIILLGVILVQSYISSSEKGENNKTNIIKKAVEKITEKEKKVKVIDVSSDKRPYAVMINNNEAVWTYQSGLNDAYIVYELLTEGGIPRELAVFQKRDVPKIQSIRSSRHYFLDYSLENDAVYVHWGWSPQAETEISYTGVDGVSIDNLNGLSGEGLYFFRDSTVNAAYEHTGYTTGEAIQNGIKAYGYRNTTESKPLLNYSIEPLDLSSMENVRDAIKVEAPFSWYYTAKFNYNSETKLYEKTQNNTEMYDYTSKKRITTKNIIIYEVGYSTIDDYGRQTLSNLGTGTGYFISEGKAVPITWEKSSRSARTIYKFENGEELKVNDGKTSLELVPYGASIIME